MEHISSPSLISDLLDCRVVTAEGKVLGHVADVQLSPGPDFKVIALMFGMQSWLYRLHVINPFRKASQPARPKVVLWESVESVGRSVIRMKPESSPIEPHTFPR